MSLAESLLPDFDEEIAATRRVLERVPEDRLDWSPHEKSMTLGRLASHVAETPGWAGALLRQDSFDVESGGDGGYEPADCGSVEEILALLDESAASAREMVAATDDEAFLRPWSLLRGGETIFSVPRIGVFRRMMIHHLIHHRGQLTVYLRLLEVPVPQTYGPTADEAEM
ncbi:MAG: DinB family protein [Gemmatimonadota bacterium]